MQTPDLVFRGRRPVGDHALVLAVADVAPDETGEVPGAVRTAVEEGADAVRLAVRGDNLDAGHEADLLATVVGQVRRFSPQLFVAVATTSAEAARAACRAGADLLDDPATTPGSELIEVAAEFGTGYIAADPGLADQAVQRGVPREGVLVDPGPDLVRIESLIAAGRAVVTSFPAHDPGPGGLALAAVATRQGAAMVRARQVLPVRHVAEMAASVAGLRPPAKAVRWQ